MIVYQLRAYANEWRENSADGSPEVFSYYETAERAKQDARKLWDENLGPKGDVWDANNKIFVTKLVLGDDKASFVAVLNTDDGSLVHRAKAAEIIWQRPLERGKKEEPEEAACESS